MSEPRVFTITLTIHEDEAGSVEIKEKGDKANSGKHSVPAGIFGVREGLRKAGNVTREYYQTKQRSLLLVARAKELEERRAARKMKPPPPAAPLVEDPAKCPDCIEARRLANSDSTTAGFFPPHCARHAPKLEEGELYQASPEGGAVPLCAQCEGKLGHFEPADGDKPETWIPCPGCQQDLTPQPVVEEPIDWANTLTSGESASPVDVAIERVVTINDRLKKAVAK